VPQVKAFGLNRADCNQREGSYPGLTPDAILGLEFAGVIVDVAASVHQWKVGDEVLGLAVGVCPSAFFGSWSLTARIHDPGRLRGVHRRP
jgi:NADPH:quinone reductase-like Zn-dependent oxidoreductase